MLLSIVIPCYNELDTVQKLSDEFIPVVQGLLGRKLGNLEPIEAVEVIFVDDGSKDGTLDALKSAFGTNSLPSITFHFIQHRINRGLGAALRTGFSKATGEVIVTTDSDGTYRFDEIPALLEYMQEGVSIVTASPYHPHGNIADVPAYRIVLSRSASLLYRLLVEYKVHTYTALFRAYRRQVVEAIPFAADGFLAGTELMVTAQLQGYRVAEYPTVLYSRVHGVSKAKIIRTIKAHLRFQYEIVLFRLGFSHLPLTQVDGVRK